MDIQEKQEIVRIIFLIGFAMLVPLMFVVCMVDHTTKEKINRKNKE